MAELRTANMAELRTANMAELNRQYGGAETGYTIIILFRVFSEYLSIRGID